MNSYSINWTSKIRTKSESQEQYLSAIFYYDAQQKQTAEYLKQLLEEKNYSIATQILPVTIFERAADYHQAYYDKTGHQPYCHFYQKKF